MAGKGNSVAGLTESDGLLELQRRCSEDGAPGLIQGHYLHGAYRNTSLEELHGRHNLVAAQLRELSERDGQTISDAAAFASTSVGRRQAMAWRGIVEATHRGSGLFGEPTERGLRYQRLSVHLVSQGRIYKEWVQTDHAAILDQLDLDVVERAAWLAEVEPRRFRFLPDFGEVRHGLGQKPPTEESLEVHGSDAISGPLVSRLNLACNHRRFDALKDFYTDDVRVHAPRGLTLDGYEAARHRWMRLLAMMSDAQLFFEQALSDGETQAALVWRLIGHHDGPGLTPRPSGVRLQVQGISQLLLRDGQVAQEWTLYDELALHKQIELARQPAPGH